MRPAVSTRRTSARSRSACLMPSNATWPKARALGNEPSMWRERTNRRSKGLQKPWVCEERKQEGPLGRLVDRASKTVWR